MKRLIPSASALSLILLPQPLLAQTQATGTVDVTGRVGGRCAVQVGAASSSTFTGTIALGELAGGNGQLSPALAGATIPSAQIAFTIICTSPLPTFKLSATRLATAATAPAGYANAVDYTVAVAVSQVSGTPPALNYATSSTPPAQISAILTGRPSNIADNVVVRVHSLNAAAGALLVAGDYTGTISLTITPS